MNPVEALLDDDTVEFRDSVHSILMDKLMDRLETERMNTSTSLFEPSYEDEEDEEGTDNDV